MLWSTVFWFDDVLRSMQLLGHLLRTDTETWNIHDAMQVFHNMEYKARKEDEMMMVAACDEVTN